MKKSNKILLTAALSTLCVGFAFGGVSFFSASAEMQNDATKFNVNGAQVKYMTNETDSGIRFNFRMSTSYYNSLVSNGAFDGVTVNAAIIPTDMVGVDATAEDVIGADKALTSEIPASVWKANGDWMEAYAYLYELPAVSYGRDISAVGYIVDGENTTYVTDVEVRSMAYVASAALYSSEYNPTEDEKEILNKYVANYEYDFSVEEDSAVLLPVAAGSYSNKQQLTVNANAPIAVTYETSNEDVVTVSATGEVTAVAAGDATITATAANGATDTFSVKVATPISSKADLDAIALDWVNNGSDPSWGVRAWAVQTYYVFTQDIDYKGEVMIPIAANGNWCGGDVNGKWGQLQPGGSQMEGNSFNGVMDGNGFAIENARLAYGSTSWGWGGLGGNFMGSLTGTLKNLAFVNLTAEDSTDANGTDDGKNVSSLTGIVGVNKGRMENIFVDIYMKRGAISAHQAGVLAANNAGTVKNCVTKVAGNSNSLVWRDATYTSDFGLLGGYNGGTFENCFTVVEGDYHNQATSTTLQYRDLFGGCYAAQNWHGVNNESWAASSMGYGTGTFTNLGRYTSVEAMLTAQLENMETYGYGDFWYNWLAENMPTMTIKTTSVVLLPVEAGSYTNEMNLGVKTYADTTVSYQSSNDAVATVDQKGNVTAVASGDATITVTAENGESVSCSVKVATPIDSKEDLDAIALDYVKNGSDPNWGVRAWAVQTYYVFTQNIDYKGEVMIPIAAIGNFCGGSWGKWGKLNPGDFQIDGNGFNGVMDGNGFAIQNAVLSIGGATWGGGGVGGNFIGYLTGTLKNLAFTNLVAESVTDAGIGGSNASNRQGIVGSLAGTMDNVFVDVYMKRGSYTAQSGGVLAAVVYKNAVMKNCVSLVDGSEDSLVWNNGNGNTFDFGLIAWTNEGVIENTFSVVKAGYHEYAMDSEIPYRDLFGATWSAAWEWGVNNEDFAKTKMGYGVGTFTNLGRYTTVAELVAAQQANMDTYGYGAFWIDWLTEYMA